jgi:DcmR-like sensory protein
MVAGIRSYLAAGGLNVRKAIENRALILTSDQSHLKEGRFDADSMLKLLSEAVAEALEDGYHGLWASGDMSWELGGGAEFEVLLKYERGLEDLFIKQPALSGICQYHQELLPVEAVKAAVYTHRSIYVNQTLSRLNPYYVQPDAPIDETIEVPTAAIRHVVEILNRPG